jgi:hypothetical protein
MKLLRSRRILAAAKTSGVMISSVDARTRHPPIESDLAPGISHEIFYQAIAITNIWTIFIFETLELIDQLLFDLALK